MRAGLLLASALAVLILAAPAAACKSSTKSASSASGGPGQAAPSAAAKPVQRVTVHVGGLGEAIDGPLFVGQDKGFFDEQGIDLDVQNFKSLAEMIPLLATGKLDAANGGTNPGFFNAVATGVGIKIISNVNVSLLPGPGIKNAQWLIVRKDLTDQVKSVADLKGRKIAINNAGSLSEEQLERALLANGLKLEDVQVQTVPFPDQLAALANKAVDAAVELEPFITLAQDRNIAVPLYDLAKALPGHPGEYLFYSSDFIKNQPEAGKRFMVAYLKSMRYIQDAWVKGINKEDVIQLHTKHTSVKDAALWQRMGYGYDETACSIDLQAIEEDQTFFLKKGVQKQKVDVKTIIDSAPCDYAKQVLGAYKP